MSKLKTIKIDRSKWRRGGKGKTGQNLAKLYDPYEPTQYNMCCLGQYLNQCGVKKGDLAEMASPADLTTDQIPKITPAIEVLVYQPENSRYLEETEITGKAMGINDNATIGGKTRESKLINLFKPLGIQLVFIN
jgi:hypothetical protein